MQWLAELCVKRPVFATVLILSLSVVGIFAFLKLGVDRYPKIDLPTVLITTVQAGAAPEQIETEITDKIEEAVNTISGIDDLRSISSEGASIVSIQFVLEKDPEVGASEIRDKTLDPDARLTAQRILDLLATSAPGTATRISA